MDSADMVKLEKTDWDKITDNNSELVRFLLLFFLLRVAATERETTGQGQAGWLTKELTIDIST